MTASARSPIDDILQKVLDAVPFRLSVDGGVHAARRALRELPRRPLHTEMRVADQHIDGPGGPIPIRVYWPERDGDRPLPVTVFFHGGGFALGDLDTHDVTARQHAATADTLVVSVDYRLAPEYPFPAAIDDAWAATQWVAENAGQFGADGSRLAVAGDSAGANLAAAVALLARDSTRAGDGPAVTFQLLWYPTVMGDTTLPSFAENANAPVLDLPTIAAFTEWYAGHLDPADPPATLAPGRAADLSGLPPAYIAVAGHDPLRDDGIRYAELLSAAGVEVELHHADSLVHGYLGFSGVVPAATAATDLGLAALRAALHGQP